MNTVAKFVRKGHYITRLAEIVQHHVGVHVGYSGVCKGPGRFAGLPRGVDPAFVKEGLSERRHFGVKLAIG